MQGVDFERLINALNAARSAFPSEIEMRRIENLPLLRVWDGLHQLEAAARSARQRRVHAPVTVVTIPHAARYRADD